MVLPLRMRRSMRERPGLHLARTGTIEVSSEALSPGRCRQFQPAGTDFRVVEPVRQCGAEMDDVAGRTDRRSRRARGRDTDGVLRP
jgi:hypothetical protein